MKSVNSIYSKKSSRKAKKRRVLLALLMLLLTGVMTATSTFAWFTANKTVSVSTINVNVAASSGLQISVDGLEWKPVITKDDLEKVIGEETTYDNQQNRDQLPTTDLSPVSSAGNILSEDGTMELFYGSVNADEDSGAYKLVAQSDVENRGNSGKFITFDLFFQVQTEETLFLTNKSTVTGGTSNNNTGIQNAARVAFFTKGNTAAGSAKDTIQSLNTVTENSNNKAVIWEPNADAHVDSALAHAASVYQKSDITNNNNTAVEYYGIKANINGENQQDLNSQDTTYFEKIEPKTSMHTGIPTNTFLELFTLKPGITKVRVYMWVEGQDIDCEDNESGGGINFDLQFSIQDPSGE